MEFIYSYLDIHDFAKKIAPLLRHKLVFLEGELGSGKTTLIKQICRELGFKDQVSSPTFPLLNIYKNNEKNIYHADLYRLKNIEEINELGFYEIMENNNWFFVEWPELLY
ncbi:MAG: tRNA (adenosine(37)-N6)-threonylcarbamoyltransferase complex ATPase subunit type 1 TsaE, partial [Flavobacteriaceae bacterium]|nr:tRNA (adenosine(37)-N6)-threonylcarbamoyltransferase complex ATPase subunit type 1 TsaE [Flavobacteriaceae bacterium]